MCDKHIELTGCKLYVFNMITMILGMKYDFELLHVAVIVHVA